MINGFQISVTTYYIHHPVKVIVLTCFRLNSFPLIVRSSSALRRPCILIDKRKGILYLIIASMDIPEEKYEVTFEGFI